MKAIRLIISSVVIAISMVAVVDASAQNMTPEIKKALAFHT